MHESDVVLTLHSVSRDLDADTLEEHMFAVLDAVEHHADDIADGAVTSVNFVDHSIELAFSLQHDGQADAQEKISRVLAIIEQHTPLDFSGHDAHVRATEEESDHAVALTC